MHVGDTSWWFALIGAVITATGLFITIRSAINKRQRELRGQLREVLRDATKACNDYRIEDFRRSAERTLVDAAKRINVIRDEGILSPKPRYLFYLQITLHDLGTREEAVRSAENMFALVTPAEQHQQLRQNYDRKTEEMRVYAIRVCTKFRQVTRRMDNGNVFTYWHFRLIPPFIRGMPDPNRTPTHPSEE